MTSLVGRDREGIRRNLVLGMSDRVHRDHHTSDAVGHRTRARHRRLRPTTPLLRAVSTNCLW